MSQRNDSIMIRLDALQSQKKLCGAPEEFSRLFPGINLTAKLVQLWKSPDREGRD